MATARKHYEQALAINPNFAIAASNLAWVYTKQGGNLDVALGLAQKAKQLMPELDSITDTLAWVQYKKGSYISAKPLLQECVRKAPQYAPYHYHWVWCWRQTARRQRQVGAGSCAPDETLRRMTQRMLGRRWQNSTDL